MAPPPERRNAPPPRYPTSPARYPTITPPRYFMIMGQRVRQVTGSTRDHFARYPMIMGQRVR